MYKSLKQFNDYLFFKDLTHYNNKMIPYYQVRLFVKYMIDKKQTRELNTKELKECKAVAYRKYKDYYITYVFNLRSEDHLKDSEFLLKHYLSGDNFQRLIQYTKDYLNW